MLSPTSTSPESCLKDNWTDDYAKSVGFESKYSAVTDLDDGEKWPTGRSQEDGKLYRNGNLLLPESQVLELCEATTTNQKFARRRPYAQKKRK